MLLLVLVVGYLSLGAGDPTGVDGDEVVVYNREALSRLPPSIRRLIGRSMFGGPVRSGSRGLPRMGGVGIGEDHSSGYPFGIRIDPPGEDSGRDEDRGRNDDRRDRERDAARSRSRSVRTGGRSRSRGSSSIPSYYLSQLGIGGGNTRVSRSRIRSTDDDSSRGRSVSRGDDDRGRDSDTAEILASLGISGGTGGSRGVRRRTSSGRRTDDDDRSRRSFLSGRYDSRDRDSDNIELLSRLGIGRGSLGSRAFGRRGGSDADDYSRLFERFGSSGRYGDYDARDDYRSYRDYRDDTSVDLSQYGIYSDDRYGDRGSDDDRRDYSFGDDLSQYGVGSGSSSSYSQFGYSDDSGDDSGYDDRDDTGFDLSKFGIGDDSSSDSDYSLPYLDNDDYSGALTKAPAKYGVSSDDKYSDDIGGLDVSSIDLGQFGISPDAALSAVSGSPSLAGPGSSPGFDLSALGIGDISIDDGIAGVSGSSDDDYTVDLSKFGIGGPAVGPLPPPSPGLLPVGDVGLPLSLPPHIPGARGLLGFGDDDFIEDFPFLSFYEGKGANKTFMGNTTTNLTSADGSQSINQTAQPSSTNHSAPSLDSLGITVDLSPDTLSSNQEPSLPPSLELLSTVVDAAGSLNPTQDVGSQSDPVPYFLPVTAGNQDMTGTADVGGKSPLTNSPADTATGNNEYITNPESPQNPPPVVPGSDVNQSEVFDRMKLLQE